MRPTKKRRYTPSARYRQNVATRSKFKFERKQKATKALLYLLAVGLVGTLCFWTYKGVTGFIFNSEYFKIQKVEVRGIKNLAQGEITTLLPFRNGDNMFSVDLSDCEDNIAKVKPELKKVSINRGWHKIVVTVEERRPVACFTLAGTRLGLDNDNKPFPLRGNWAKEFLPEIMSPLEQERGTVLSFIKAFPPKAKDYFSGIIKFYVQPVDRVILEMKDGSKIYWGPFERSKVDIKLKKLLQVLRESSGKYSVLEYVNLSFFDDGRILIKPRK